MRRPDNTKEVKRAKGCIISRYLRVKTEKRKVNKGNQTSRLRRTSSKEMLERPLTQSNRLPGGGLCYGSALREALDEKALWQQGTRLQ